VLLTRGFWVQIRFWECNRVKSLAIHCDPTNLKGLVSVAYDTNSHKNMPPIAILSTSKD